MAPLGTLHGTPHNPRVRKIFAAAAIAKVEIPMTSGFKFGESNKDPTFLSKFPLGKVPALETSVGFHLSESYAIAYYAAERSATIDRRNQLLGSTLEERALNQQWIFFASLDLQPTVNNLCGWRMGFAKYDVDVERSSALELKRWLDYLETAIKGREWFVNAETGPSLADISVASTLYYAFQTYLDQELRANYPELVAWYMRFKDVKDISSIFEGDIIENRLKQPAVNE